jgi:hypothetical protein
MRSVSRLATHLALSGYSDDGHGVSSVLDVALVRVLRWM